jgi:hypothetical protein
VVVTSVLQTTAGKMIFGRYLDPALVGQSAHGGDRQKSGTMPAAAASTAGGAAPVSAAIAAAPAAPQGK